MIRQPAILILLLSNVFTQVNQDARMLGLNGSYTTLASGFRAVGINPANLAVYQDESWNIIDFSLGLSNNYFSIENYNALSGSHLNDTEHENYYPKEKILDEFSSIGLRMRQSLNIPIPLLNISKGQYAITSRFTSNFDVGLSDGMIQAFFSGNPYGKEIYINIEEVLFATQEIGFSYGHSFYNYTAGITVKYLLGLFYMGMESLSSPTITTDLYGSHGNPKYVARQAIGGNGLGLDVGITSNEFDEGFRFGVSIINLLGTIKWTQDNFIRERLEPSLSKTDFYLRQNEWVYINIMMDSVAASSFLTEDSNDPFIYYEVYKVLPIKTIDELTTMTSVDEALVVKLSDGTYLFPSGGKYTLVDLYGDADTTFTVDENNYSNYSTRGVNPFKTRQPMYLRMGLSKRWDDQAVVALDLVTGFSNRFSSSSNWRLSLGTEITRFKNKFLRMGYAVGGMARKSLSFGYGAKMGSLYFDIGLSLNGGFSLDSTRGFDIAAGILWQSG